MAPRNREKNKDLDGLPGLKRKKSGMYHIVHPVSKREGSLKTKDLAKAKQLYQILMTRWKKETGELAADAFLDRIDKLTREQADVEIPTLAAYAHHWRTDWLGVTMLQQGEKRRLFQFGDCKVMSSKGKALARGTVRDYAGFCLNKYEPDTPLQRLYLDDRQLTKKLRQFLAGWSTKPVTYNHHLACLSKILQQAVRDGLIDRNPCSDIDLAVVPKKTEEQVKAQYIDDDTYARITEQLMVDEQSGKKYDGEWQARLVDVMFFMSSRPADAIQVKDDAFDENGYLKYETNKTSELIAIEDMTGDLAETVLWFRTWKKANGIISPYLCVQPKYKRHGVAGKPVTVKYLSRKFSQAVIDAGYPKGSYVLRLIRHKGLTDEAKLDKANNKGGHRTETGRQPYIVERMATNVTNNLRNPRKRSGKVTSIKSTGQ